MVSTNTSLQSKQVTAANKDLLSKAIRIDIFQPTLEEEKLVETAISMNIPTPEEMREIEVSSRLYKENNSLYMTATMLANSATLEPKMDAVTFILTKTQLITVRYLETQAFTTFIANTSRFKIQNHPTADVLFGLLEAVTDRIADILEQVGHGLDHYSQIIFRPNPENGSRRKVNYQKILQDIGGNGDLSAKARESLVSFSRLVGYLAQGEEFKFDETKSQLTTLTKRYSCS